MTRQSSKVQQHTAVGEGLALGCLLQGVTGVTTATMDVEFAFRHAWEKWPWATRFPAVRATVPNNDVLRIIDMSPRRRGVIVAQWDNEGTIYAPAIFSETVQEAGEVLAKSYGVPLEAWGELAAAFSEGLGEGKVCWADAKPPESNRPK